MHYNINFDVVLARLKQCKGFGSNKEIAEIFGISEPDFSRRKKKGTLLPLVIAWALDNQVNIDWLLTGRSSPAGEGGRREEVRDPGKQYDSIDVDLLRTILEAVEIHLDQRGQNLPAGKKAQAVALLYEFYSGVSKSIDTATVGRYLDLAADE